jgi:Septum formation
MSSQVTGDAQPDAGPEAKTDHTLPTEIVENSAGAGAVTVAENTEPTAESHTAPEPAAESAPDEPAEVTKATDGDDPAAGDEPAELPESEAQAETGPEAGAEAPAEETGTENLAELEDPAEPTELIAMAEPIELAEPVDDPRPRRRGHGVLIACVFVVAALVIVGGAIAIVGSLTHGFKKPVVIHYTKSAVFSLKTGQCIDPNGQTATVVSCTTPHGAEVFATFSLPGSSWPGTTAVTTAASAGCSTRLTGYLNPQLAISLSSTYIYPDEVAWQAGTRTVICEVRATSGQLTGSVRGASATAS